MVNFWSPSTHLLRLHLRLSCSIEDDPPLCQSIFFADHDLDCSLWVRRLSQSALKSSLTVDLLDSAVSERYKENPSQIPHPYPCCVNTSTSPKTASPCNSADILKRGFLYYSTLCAHQLSKGKEIKMDRTPVGQGKSEMRTMPWQEHPCCTSWKTTSKEKWDEDKTLAIASMLHHVKDNIISLFEEHDTAKEMMEALDTKYGCKVRHTNTIDVGQIQ